MIQEDNKQNILQRPVMVAFLACLCCFLWGSAFPSVKVGYQLFQVASDDSISQILFAGCRFTLAGILTVLIGSALQKKPIVPKKNSWGMIGKLAMVQTIAQYFFFYIGMAHTSGLKGSIINGANTFLTILLACFVFRMEKMNVRKMAGCIIGFAGVIIINLNPTGLGGGVRLDGEGFLLMAALCYGVSSIMIKKYSLSENPVTLSGYQFIIGGIVMIIASVVMGGALKPVSGMAFLLLLYMGALSALAYSVWGILLKHNPVGKVSIYGVTNPIFGAILSAVILREGSQISVIQTLAALLCVCTGIYLVNRVS